MVSAPAVQRGDHETQSEETQAKNNERPAVPFTLRAAALRVAPELLYKKTNQHLTTTTQSTYMVMVLAITCVAFSVDEMVNVFGAVIVTGVNTNLHVKTHRQNWKRTRQRLREVCRGCGHIDGERSPMRAHKYVA